MMENVKTRVVEIRSLSWTGGSHLSFQGCLYDTILKAIYMGMNCCQLFLGSPKTFERRKCTYDDIFKTKKLVNLFDFGVFIHTPYIFSLVGSTKQLAWDGDTVQDNKTKKILKSLEYELSVASNFRRNGVIIHPGSFPDREKGIDAIVKSINKINFPENSMLLLENCAGEGNKIPRNFDELSQILTAIKNKENVGVCVDTAHIHGMGDYDLSKISEVDRMFEEFDQKIGLGKLKLFHLNDSKVLLGSKKDHHALLETGYIYGKSNLALLHLLRLCKKHEIPMVLETHPSDMYKLMEYDV